MFYQLVDEVKARDVFDGLDGTVLAKAKARNIRTYSVVLQNLIKFSTSPQFSLAKQLRSRGFLEEMYMLFLPSGDTLFHVIYVVSELLEGPL